MRRDLSSGSGKCRVSARLGPRTPSRALGRLILATALESQVQRLFRIVCFPWPAIFARALFAVFAAVSERHLGTEVPKPSGRKAQIGTENTPGGKHTETGLEGTPPPPSESRPRSDNLPQEPTPRAARAAIRPLRLRTRSTHPGTRRSPKNHCTGAAPSGRDMARHQQEHHPSSTARDEKDLLPGNTLHPRWAHGGRPGDKAALTPAVAVLRHDWLPGRDNMPQSLAGRIARNNGLPPVMARVPRMTC
jgi:hypothetical protein